MGQAASQVARRVTASISRNAVTPRPTRPPSRFQPPDDRGQQEFLRQAAGGTTEYKEMSDDLVQFLKDVGPLKKQENKEKGDDDKSPTSTTAAARRRQPYWDRPDQQDASTPESSSSETATSSTTSLLQDSTRIQQSMRLMHDVEGFDTVRTTSFSHKTVVTDAKDFGLDAMELYRLLSHYNKNENNEAVAEYYEQRLQGVDVGVVWNEDETKEHLRLLQQTAQSIELPALFKDTDGDYVGVSSERIQEVTHIGLVQMPKDKIKLVVEDLSEMDKEESELSAVSA